MAIPTQIPENMLICMKCRGKGKIGNANCTACKGEGVRFTGNTGVQEKSSKKKKEKDLTHYKKKSVGHVRAVVKRNLITVNAGEMQGQKISSNIKN